MCFTAVSKDYTCMNFVTPQPDILCVFATLIDPKCSFYVRDKVVREECEHIIKKILA